MKSRIFSRLVLLVAVAIAAASLISTGTHYKMEGANVTMYDGDAPIAYFAGVREVTLEYEGVA